MPSLTDARPERTAECAVIGSRDRRQQATIGGDPAPWNPPFPKVSRHRVQGPAGPALFTNPQGSQRIADR